MDALPDELLLHILGFVADAPTLLDAVPLVCRRWHRLHREPAAWARVHIKYGGTSCSSLFRELLHAPAAIVLDVTAPPRAHSMSPSFARRLSSALRRTSVATLRSADLSGVILSANDDTYAAVVGLLRRQGDHLRRLHVRVDLRAEPSPDASLLGAVAAARRLRHLRVVFGALGQPQLRRAFVGGGLSAPGLEVLMLDDMGDEHALDAYSEAVALMIGGSGAALPSLRSLVLTKGLERRAAADAVAGLGGLQELTVYLSALSAWDGPGCDAFLRQLDGTLAACRRLGSLLRLLVVADSLDSGRRRLQPATREALRTFQEFRPDVAVEFRWE
ncbi:hypothetical protein ONE63_005004 [Megalurothrips usitatus]|uniref:F-box domain-containing protein n=1 Tax=Megalurothrips usitatus TaxID=439358 RepID=A0AAV7X1I4_9NEOP|nr:hypothetical protein ONE63_005004 [Megalurothrips usitatus]